MKHRSRQVPNEIYEVKEEDEGYSKRPRSQEGGVGFPSSEISGFFAHDTPKVGQSDTKREGTHILALILNDGCSPPFSCCSGRPLGSKSNKTTDGAIAPRIDIVKHRERPVQK